MGLCWEPGALCSGPGRHLKPRAPGVLLKSCRVTCLVAMEPRRCRGHVQAPTRSARPTSRPAQPGQASAGGIAWTKPTRLPGGGSSLIRALPTGARKQGPRGPGSHPLGAGTGQRKPHGPRPGAAGAGVTRWLWRLRPLPAGAGLPPAPWNTALFPRQPTKAWFTEPRCSHPGPRKRREVMGFPGRVAGDGHRSDSGVSLP